MKMARPFTITTSMWQYYVDTWRAMFREILGWSDWETMRWAEGWKAVVDVDDPADMFYHESPQYWAKSQFIPADLKERISRSDWLDLQQRLLLAFWDEHRDHFPLDTDW